jgi:hypothetical protein
MTNSPATEQPRPLVRFLAAAVYDYDAIIEACRARQDELGLSTEAIDELTKWAGGYAGKVLGQAQVKRLSIETLFRLCGTLALRIVIEPDPDRLLMMQRRWSKRQETSCRPGHTARYSKRVITRVAREIGKMGRGKRKRFRISEKQVSIQRRMAARARWAKHRAQIDLARPGRVQRLANKASDYRSKRPKSNSIEVQ